MCLYGHANKARCCCCCYSVICVFPPPPASATIFHLCMLFDSCLVVLLFLLDDTTILPLAREEKTGDTHICAPVQRYVYPSCEHHNIPSLHVVWLLVVLLVVLDDIDDISFSKKIKVKNEGDTHIACVASVSNRRSYCAKVRAGTKKKVDGWGGGEKRKQFTSFPSPSPVIPFFGSRPCNFLDELARKRLLPRLYT